MDTLVEDTRLLPADIDAQPAGAGGGRIAAGAARVPRGRSSATSACRPRSSNSCATAGFYRMVIPRSLGGLQVDPLTYTARRRVAGRGRGSVGWNLANNSIGQLVTLGLPDEGVAGDPRPKGHPVIAGTAVQGGGQAVPVAGGYRVNGRWSFGSGCRRRVDARQLPDPRRRRAAPAREGRPLYWRGVFPKRESRDRRLAAGTWPGCAAPAASTGRCTTCSCRSGAPWSHAGVPLDNQWDRWPGVTYALPSDCWVGPHHSSVITGIARAGIDALIDLAGGKTPRGRTGLLYDNPQVQDAVGRADAILNAGRGLSQRDDRRAVEARRRRRGAPRWSSAPAAGWPPPTPPTARAQAMDLVYRHGGSTSFKRESRLAECWRDLHVVGQTVTVAPEWYPIGGRVYLGIDPGPRLR